MYLLDATDSVLYMNSNTSEPFFAESEIFVPDSDSDPVRDPVISTVLVKKQKIGLFLVFYRFFITIYFVCQ
jgi:hypothetical protein